MGFSRWVRLATPMALLGMIVPSLPEERRGAVEKPARLEVVEVKEPDGQILSYRYVGHSTEVLMRGTRLAPEARAKLKVGSRPGFVELDINRGHISGLKPAARFGKDYLTYVFWAVSVDGKASNLGEITFEGERPVSVNVTTPYQTFWLMVTAEPDYAVVDPSPRVVLYSMNQNAGAQAPEKKALSIRGDLFFFTHYTTYDSAPAGVVEHTPNELLQARKAVELASKSGILAVDRPAGAGAREEEHTREALTQAKAFLAQAEDAYQKNPKGGDVIQFARTAAQIAENARALARGAVGGIRVRQLEDELASMRDELARLHAELSRLRSEQPKEPAKLRKETESSPPAAKPAAAPPTVETKPENPPSRLASRPIVWFGLLGWAVALMLLFRRRSV